MKVYEFYLNTEWGDNTWHWDLKQWKFALEDFLEHKNEDKFVFEIQITDEEGCDWVEIYPNNETHLLPKYVQKYVTKVMNAAKEVK